MAEPDSRRPIADPASEREAAPAAVPEELHASFAWGGLYRFFTTGDGIRLRHAFWPAPERSRRVGRIVVLGGRGEFTDKYAGEMVSELLGRGFDVHAMDWRGQGLSQRLLPDAEKGHVEDFADYARDLGEYLDQVVTRMPGVPTFLLGHSMGGHTILRHLAQHPGQSVAQGAILCAPMTGLRHALLIRSALLTAPKGSGRAHDYALGAGPFAEIRRFFSDNLVTSDPRRYAFTEWWFRADPRLKLGGVTYQWLRAGFDSMAWMAQPGVVERIAVPVLLLSAGHDRLVDPATHPRLAARLKHGRLAFYEEAQHEIMMETDAIRARFWADFDAFVGGMVAR
ncbi:MAG: alpha/beta fold hydrolase [Reyranellaceae bacterium]